MNACFVSGTPVHSSKCSDVAICQREPEKQWRRMKPALEATNILTQEEFQREQWDSVRALLGGEWVGTYEKRDFKEGSLEEPKDKGDLHYIIKFPKDTPDSGTWEGRKTANKQFQGRFRTISYDNFREQASTSYVMEGVAGQSTPEWNPKMGKWILEVNFLTTDSRRRSILTFYEPLAENPKPRLTGFQILTYRDGIMPGKVPIDESITPIDRIKKIPSLEPTSSMAMTVRGGDKKYYEPTEEEAHFSNMFGADRTLIPMRDSMFASVPEVIGEGSELYFGMSTSSGAQLLGVRLGLEGIPRDWFTSMYGNHNSRTAKN